MRRAALVIVLAGCVPASEELPPRGAAGVATVPSAETQGAPFVTNDGWTVTMRKLVLQVSVSATTESLGYGSSEPYVFDAQKPATMFSRALPIGRARVTVTPYGRYIGYSDNDYLERVERINVDEETNARFNRLPDEGQDTPYTPGPSVLLVARAERNGTVVTLDAALNVTASGRVSLDEQFGTTVEVRKNELSSVELVIDAKAIFPAFEDIARSDTDGDGGVTANELEASKALTTLEQRLAAAFVR